MENAEPELEQENDGVVGLLHQLRINKVQHYYILTVFTAPRTAGSPQRLFHCTYNMEKVAILKQSSTVRCYKRRESCWLITAEPADQVTTGSKNVEGKSHS